MECRRATEAMTLFRALLDQAHDAIEVVDPKTARYLDVNEMASRVHGYTRDEYLARSVFDVDPQVAARGEHAWHTFIANLQQTGFKVFESQHRRKDGLIFPVEVNASYIKLDRDYLLAIVRDITDRKHAEQQIRRLNRLYAVLSGINVPVMRERNPTKVIRGRLPDRGRNGSIPDGMDRAVG